MNQTAAALDLMRSPAKSLTPRRHVFTTDVVRRMADAGLLGNDRVELIEGEIYDMPEEGTPHQDLRDRIVAWFYRALIPIDPTLFVSTNGPLRISPRNSPEPDVYLRPGDVPLAELLPADVLLGIEIAFTSHTHDFRRKTPVYARSGLRELWIIDGPNRLTVVHRSPASDGSWGDLDRIAAEEPIAPIAFPGLRFCLADHLPPEAKDA